MKIDHDRYRSTFRALLYFLFFSRLYILFAVLDVSRQLLSRTTRYLIVPKDVLRYVSIFSSKEVYYPDNSMEFDALSAFLDASWSEAMTPEERKLELS